jgi:hypothetical protein
LKHYRCFAATKTTKDLVSNLLNVAFAMSAVNDPASNCQYASKNLKYL